MSDDHLNYHFTCHSTKTFALKFCLKIVVNARTGIDVEKCDYLARDSHYLGIKSSFDHTRFMNLLRVIDIDGEKQICTRDKVHAHLQPMILNTALILSLE